MKWTAAVALLLLSHAAIAAEPAIELSVSPLVLLKVERCESAPADPGQVVLQCTARNYAAAPAGSYYRLVAITEDGREVSPSTYLPSVPPNTSVPIRIVIANGGDIGKRVELRPK